MRNKIFLLPLFAMLAFMILGCDNSESNSGGNVVNNNEFSHDQISSNLAKSGTTEPNEISGVWNCVKFAYTADGNTIVDVTLVSKGVLTIPVTHAFTEEESDNKWQLSHSNDNFFVSSLSGNDGKLTLRGSTYAMGPPEEIELLSALENAYCFVVKGSELIIYFTGEKDKNLLIFERRSL